MNNEDYIFEQCQYINTLLNNKQESDARDSVIKLLDFLNQNNIAFSQLVNHLIREVGLYPYMRDSLLWEDELVCVFFKANVGESEEKTLHRAQSKLLKKLLDGENIAVSAPTSFGKSFIIDAFIAIKHPKNVVIIVPTIALMDETRRRLFKKFANRYKIVTTTDMTLGDNNIFVFPQERALTYTNNLGDIDILIIDEFYKSSINVDKERAPSLIKCIINLGEKAKQRYYLAPNIDELQDNPFTQGMTFEKIDFKTVFLEVNNLYSKVLEGKEKSDVLLEQYNNITGKSLIYAGTFSEIDNLRTLFSRSDIQYKDKELLNQFSKWLDVNYGKLWYLSDLVKKGIGIHHGKLHRSLSQIQIRLFEEKNGLDTIISTSSIIEGVNTSAENVFIWRNKNGNRNLNDFTYKNIIGRGGRMFKHFIGKIFVLDKTPQNETIQLSLPLPEDIVLNETELESIELPQDQKTKIIIDNKELESKFGDDYALIQTAKTSQIKTIVSELEKNKKKWNGLNYINSSNPDNWGYLLNNFLWMMRWEYKQADKDKIVDAIKICSNNWSKPMATILDELKDIDMGIEEYFSFEKKLTFDMASFLSDFNIIQKKILDITVDIEPFIMKIRSAFLPPVVFLLEEFGLPRTISRKIHDSYLVDFEENGLTTQGAIEQLVDKMNDVYRIETLDFFDKYILDYFYQGIKYSDEN